MLYPINENQQFIRQAVRDFASLHIAPNVREWDETQHFPASLFPKLGEMGLMGMLVPERYGGAGLGYVEYMTAIVELSRVDPSIGLSMAAHNSLCTNHILHFGNDAQKEQYLPDLATGKNLGAWALTEPGTGSDAANMKTVARKSGNKWILNGTKNFITHGKSSDTLVVIARTDTTDAKSNATAFILTRSTPGLSAGKKEDKLGMRASETTEVIFQDCEVDDSQRLGEVGDGFRQALHILDGGRISIASLSVGTALGAYEAALFYAKQREQFGKPIAQFQGISFKLADMYTRLSASAVLTYHAASLKDQDKKVTLESAVAKYHASETAVHISNEAVQILGGYGFTKDYPVEKFYRDCKLCTIGEGTSEIQKVVISREILR